MTAAEWIDKFDPDLCNYKVIYIFWSAACRPFESADMASGKLRRPDGSNNNNIHKSTKKVNSLRKNNVIGYCIDDPKFPFKGVRVREQWRSMKMLIIISTWAKNSLWKTLEV